MTGGLPPRLIGTLAGIIVALAGVGAYLQASAGGLGTTALIVRLLLVSLAIAGALILGLAVRVQMDTSQHRRLAPAARLEREQ
jgi:hypothetical protein